tara:strand:+ start:514 stop:1335 length:822 start_codon:yes stop_codon:yes gene_type:complete
MGTILIQSPNNDQRRIWLIAGTGEGPEIARMLLKDGWKVSVSVVSISASFIYEDLPLENLWVKDLEGPEGIIDVLNDSAVKKKTFNWIVDATHPFAMIISRNLKNACLAMNQPLIRFERTLDKTEGIHLIRDLKSLSQFVLTKKKVLLAIGSRRLKEAVSIVKVSGGEPFARVLSSVSGLRKALESGLSDENIAALTPSGREPLGAIEKELCHRWNIDFVVCRQSGGLVQNIWEEVSHENKIQLIMLSRPKDFIYSNVVYSLDSLLKKVSVLN